MIFLYPYFTINKLSFTGLNVIIYNQSIAAVSPLVGGAEGEFKWFCKVLLLTLPCCLAFFVTFPLLPHCFVGVVLTSARRWALAWLLRQKLQLFVVATFTTTYPLVQLMRCFEYVFRSFFPDIRKRRTHVDLRRTYKQNGRTAIIATLVILSLLQTPAGSCLFWGQKV